MIRRPPRSTRTDTLFPYATRFRSRLAAVERDLVEVLVVRVAPVLHADAAEPHRARPWVHAQHFGDIARAAGHRVLELAAGRVVQVQVAPVVALAEPQDLVRARQEIGRAHV